MEQQYKHFKVIFDIKSGNCEGVELVDIEGTTKRIEPRPLDEVTFAEIRGDEVSFKDLLGLSEIQKIRFIKKPRPGGSICSITVGDIEFYYFC